jgi:hypothetical protein
LAAVPRMMPSLPNAYKTITCFCWVVEEGHGFGTPSVGSA